MDNPSGCVPIFTCTLKIALDRTLHSLDIPQYRLVEMFTSVSNADHKSKISRLFKEASKLKVVVATIAFGMGMDCPNVQQIIHAGLPDDICSYIQETGHAGREKRLWSLCFSVALTILWTKILNSM